MTDEDRERLVVDELRQREEEGCEVAALREGVDRLAERTPARLDAILQELSTLMSRPAFPYREPSDWPGIQAERPGRPRPRDRDVPADQLLDKIRGGWLGRCAGCLLGKPVEGLHKTQIETWLHLADAYPLATYFPPVEDRVEAPEWLPRRVAQRGCLVGHITHMPRDDDLDYPILNLHLLQEVGLQFTTADVGTAWLTLLPYLKVYTAERAAYRNLVNGLAPPATATYRNPYREWIGAQIRADLWGYVTPGAPERGAALAYRDACLSHVKNGLYGALWVSAMISAAFTARTVAEVIAVGRAAIPDRSRLAEALDDVVAWSGQHPDWRATWTRIEGKYGRYHRVHTINNAALVLLGLLYGAGDFARSITISVMGGWDTDCNGATTGSILGVLLGAAKLPPPWITPLHDRVESLVAGAHSSRISDLAQRTFHLAIQGRS